ncbi:MAG: hypothetical protein ACI9ZV_000148 [Candidatus Azotimanducaceae bacterium]|jgi:hypothetical protein
MAFMLVLSLTTLIQMRTRGFGQVFGIAPIGIQVILMIEKDALESGWCLYLMTINLK